MSILVTMANSHEKLSPCKQCRHETGSEVLSLMVLEDGLKALYVRGKCSTTELHPSCNKEHHQSCEVCSVGRRHSPVLAFPCPGWCQAAPPLQPLSALLHIPIAFLSYMFVGKTEATNKILISHYLLVKPKNTQMSTEKLSK